VLDRLSLEFITASDDNIEDALSTDAHIFHYSGHADFDNGRGYLVKQINRKGYHDPLYCETLAISLRKAQTRIAVLMACNSGRWQVARPLLHAGLPVLVGAQGIVTTVEANTFSQRIYNYLGAGLSLDEAVSDARVDLLDLPVHRKAPAAGLARFIVYMPSRDAVLIPRPDDAETAEIQSAVKQFNFQFITNIEKQHIDQVGGDKISFGDISGESVTIAAGREAQTSIEAGLNVDELEQLFKVIYQQIQDRPVGLDVDKSEISQIVQLIEKEAAKGEEVNSKKVERWLKNLAVIAPDILKVTVATLANPAAGVSGEIRLIADEVKAETG
jgi:hypothetical protein